MRAAQTAQYLNNEIEKTLNTSTTSSYTTIVVHSVQTYRFDRIKVIASSIYN